MTRPSKFSSFVISDSFDFGGSSLQKISPLAERSVTDLTDFLVEHLENVGQPSVVLQRKIAIRGKIVVSMT